MLTLLQPNDLSHALQDIHCSEESYPFFDRKKETYLLRVYQIDYRAATILKQCFLSAGGDVAVHKHVLDQQIKNTDAILIGTRKIFNSVLTSLMAHPYFSLPALQQEITHFFLALDRRQNRSLPMLMGIINITPDSFSQDGLLHAPQEILHKAQVLIEEGADLLDIGGESSRPGAFAIDEVEELHRVIPVIQMIRKEFPRIALSVDTYKPSVAKICIEEGVNLINCIRISQEMLELLASYPEIRLVAMHMKGSPQTMQQKTDYTSLVMDIHSYFEEILHRCDLLSIKSQQIILDPGIGFAKTAKQSVQIMKEITSFFDLQCPILVGHSRKSFFQETLGFSLHEREVPTAILSAFLWNQGVDILRVHNVKDTLAALKTEALFR